MTYRYEFDETGGYDCMYGAFRVSGPDGVVVDVDLQHYGQQSCDYKDEASKAKAEVIAKRITDALNGSGEAIQPYPFQAAGVFLNGELLWEPGRKPVDGTLIYTVCDR
jgi:hypothetical protein